MHDASSSSSDYAAFLLGASAWTRPAPPLGFRWSCDGGRQPNRRWARRGQRRRGASRREPEYLGVITGASL